MRGAGVGARAVLLCVSVVIGCAPSTSPQPGDGLTPEEFSGLLEGVARAWEGERPESAARLFAADAVYMQPPDVQLFRGTGELRAYFGAVEPGTYL